MSRNIKFAVEEYYHVYNRGTDKRNIFEDKKDYERFMASMLLFNNDKKAIFSNILKRQNKYRGRTAIQLVRQDDLGENLVNIIAYSLMSNHFHFLITEKKEGGISLFMKKLQNGYTSYFNKKYDRSGVLFQGKFKAKHCDNDPYIDYLFHYIHFNPIDLIDVSCLNVNESITFLSNYRYSSLIDYVGSKRIESKVINKKNIPIEYSHEKLKVMFQEYMRFREISRSDRDIYDVRL